MLVEVLRKRSIASLAKIRIAKYNNITLEKFYLKNLVKKIEVCIRRMIRNSIKVKVSSIGSPSY